MIESMQLYDEDRIKNITLDLIPLEDDLLSLEMVDNFAHYMLGDDDSYKVYVQNSINRLESLFGPIKYKYAKGSDSVQILKRLRDTATLLDTQSSDQADTAIDCLVMIDRDIDLVSPFCVNQTYEGLLDEFFKIKTCSIKVDTVIVKPDVSKDPKAPV